MASFVVVADAGLANDLNDEQLNTDRSARALYQVRPMLDFLTNCNNIQ